MAGKNCDKCAPPSRILFSPLHPNKDLFGEHLVSSCYLVLDEIHLTINLLHILRFGLLHIFGFNLRKIYSI